MKNYIKILFIALPALLVACEDNDKTFSFGQIVGYDATLCACCGGYVIEIEGKTYRFFDDDIKGSNPFHTMDITYPFHVWLEWSVQGGQCPGRITVHKIMVTSPK